MHSGFVIYSYLKDSAFTACFNRDAKFQTRYVKGVPFAYTGLLIFREVADPRNSGISAKSHEIPPKTRNTAKSARNISKYLSAKHI